MIATIASGAHISYRWRRAPARDASSDSDVPVVLFRPLAGSIALWGELADRIAEAHDVLAFDPLGVGESSDVPWFHSTRDMARDARALFDTLGVSRAHVVGVSLGGMVATWMAVDAPDRVAKLILVSTLPSPWTISRHVARHVLRATMRARSSKTVERAMVDEVVSDSFRRTHPERMREIESAIAASPVQNQNLLRLVLAATLHHVNPDVRNLHAPTMLVFGASDPLVGRRSREELEREVPRARVEILEGAGHDLSLERPRDLAEIVLRFVREDRGLQG